jgi:lysosomal acid lipase/cholesteryl ester hydrolase
MERRIPLYTLDGVRGAEQSTHYISTDDGLGLSLLRFERTPCDDVVVLIHGLTSSSDMFIMPEHNNLVSYLLDNGLSDVWCLDFRMSNRHSYNLYPNSYSMDDCALYDHPRAFEYIRNTVGEGRRIHVIGHCLGSMTFAMSLAAKQVTGISSFISNSISLTPRIHPWSNLKLTLFPFILERLLDVRYVSPGWAYEPRLTLGKLLSKLISVFHHECDEPACHTLSLMWGTGWPALFMHENLDERTHARLHDLFGATGLNYHRHVRKMVSASNQAIKFKKDDSRYEALPDNYLEAGLSIDTPILFVTGDKNRVFTDSNIHCYQQMKQRGVKHHQRHVYENYGHQDVFMGKHADKDIFPVMLDFINRQREA